MTRAEPVPPAAPEPEASAAPDPTALPWETGSRFGHGVAFKDTQNRAGENVFIGYAGCRVSLS
jgi:hypothetical protein